MTNDPRALLMLAGALGLLWLFIVALFPGFELGMALAAALRRLFERAKDKEP